MQVSEELLREVAEQIILDHATDIEYSTVREMSYDELDMADRTDEEQDEIWRKLDKIIRSAKITVEFGDA